MALKKINIKLSKIWVLIVSSLSVALVACVCSKKSVEKKQDTTVMQMELDSLKKVQEHRNAVVIYGTPDVMKRYGEENERLQHRIDSLQNAIDEAH